MSSYYNSDKFANSNINYRKHNNKKRLASAHFEADYRISPLQSCNLLDEMEYSQGRPSHSSHHQVSYEAFDHPEDYMSYGNPHWNQKMAQSGHYQTPNHPRRKTGTKPKRERNRTNHHNYSQKFFPNSAYSKIDHTKVPRRNKNRHNYIQMGMNEPIKHKNKQSRLLLDLRNSSSNETNQDGLCQTDCSPVESNHLPLSFQGLSKDNIRARIRLDRERKFQKSLEALLKKREDLYHIFEDISVDKEFKRKILCKEGQINWFDGTKDKRGKLLHVFGLRITNAVHKGHTDEINLRFQ